jgi:hypothetical protein
MRTTFAVMMGLTAAIATTSVHADRGMIPFRPHVQIFEPNQRAMIAWNGTEEILLLSTDLRASEATKVLEVIPLPSEPKVKKGDVEVFKRATELINEKLGVREVRMTSARHANSPSFDRAIPAGEVTFHKKIGPHDISVTRVNDATGFVQWVQKYLRSNRVVNPLIPPEVRTAVANYLKDGFSWFVFDLVELDAEPKTNDAIQYRFKSDALFYPLRISRVGKGDTAINLLILSPYLFESFLGVSRDRVDLEHPPITITSAELRSLNQDMADSLGAKPRSFWRLRLRPPRPFGSHYKLEDDDAPSQDNSMKLRIWRLRGALSSFDADLIAKP